jgi:hypothetical protein
VQFQDHPPKATPVSAGAVIVTIVPKGYVAVQTEPEVEAGPQLITFGVPVADGAVSSQPLVFNPALKTVSVTSNPEAIVSSLHVPGVAAVGGTGGVAVGSPGLAGVGAA